MTTETTKGEGYTFQKAVRAPFLTVVTPQKVGKKGQEKGEPIFGLTVIMDPNGDDAKALKIAMAKIADEMWPGRRRQLKEAKDALASAVASENAAQVAAQTALVASLELKFPIVSGDTQANESQKAGKDGEFFRGQLVFKATSGSDKPPKLGILEGKTPRELAGAQHEIEGKQKFYNGCYVVPSVWLKAYKNGKEGGIGEHSGVKAYLSSVLWVKDGPRIGGSSVADTFKAYAGNVTEEDPTAGAADDFIV